MPEPRDKDDGPPIPLSREETLQTVAVSLTMLRVQIGPGKRLPGQSDGDRREIAKRLVDYLELCGLGICRMRWSRPRQWMLGRPHRL